MKGDEEIRVVIELILGKRADCHPGSRKVRPGPQQNDCGGRYRDLPLRGNNLSSCKVSLLVQISGSLTSALESTPLPIASRPRPARGMPAVIPPFLGLFGLRSVQVSITFDQDGFEET